MALILVPVEYSLSPIVETVRAVDKVGIRRTKASIVESSSLLSESEGKLYYLSSSSLVSSLEYSSSNESGGEENSN